MNIVIDSKNPNAEMLFGHLGNVCLLPTAEITADSVRDADVLVVRSETKVGRDLLDGSKVRFVGTATIGTDHIDQEYLKAKNIGFVSAPGSNSNSVAEYVVAGMLLLAVRTGTPLARQTIGVVGVGNVGSKVARMGSALGMTVLQNDPPLARSTGDVGYLPLESLMNADIISLHVPLTTAGNDPTRHLFDSDRISRMKPGAVLFNTSRGAVVDTAALKTALAQNRLSGAVLDVWEGEPSIDTGLLDLVTLGTPHIAGYSLDGKLNAIAMVYDGVCKHFGKEPRHTLEAPEQAGHAIDIHAPVRSLEQALHDVVAKCYDIEGDDRMLRTAMSVPSQERAARFRKLRTDYPIRREFAHTIVDVDPSEIAVRKMLSALGFVVKESPRFSSQKERAQNS